MKNLISQNVWCRIFNLHKYEIIKEETLINKHGYIIGIVIISKCSNCGKIKSKTIYTEEGYGKY